ncbi:MAG: PIN domain-containing protein [Deltaproteobacteria bacterium]|nr:PIN domain-containing protein [Deltaproteobacteria bacterium]
MIRGIDTTFLVEAEVVGHPKHARSRSLLAEVISDGGRIAIAPQILAEFAHVVTDARRFEHPLEMSAALVRVSLWWNAVETKQVFPNAETIALFGSWMSGENLGRKRILDTMLAATYVSNGITSLITSNSRDYSVFKGLEVTTP